MVVYDTALANGWQNWSWAKADLGVELSGSARKPIRVVAGPWQAMYLHHEPFNTTGLKKISFLIQGSAPDGDVRLFALENGKPIGEGYLIKLGNTGWKQVEQPLSVLYDEIVQWGQPRPPSTHFVEYDQLVSKGLQDIAFGADPKKSLDDLVSQVDAALSR